jgi:endoglucanase
VHPGGQLIAEAHVYGKNVCSSASCFDSEYAQVPLLYGETGETYDGWGYIQSIMGWAEPPGSTATRPGSGTPGGPAAR